MHRILILLAVIGLLAACTNQGDGATEEPSESAVSTPVMGSPEPSGATGTTPSTECSESFADIAAENPTSITDLGNMADQVEPTIENCESIDEWIGAAQQLFDDELNPNTVRLLLGLRCGSPSLSQTEICRELASS